MIEILGIKIAKEVIYFFLIVVLSIISYNVLRNFINKVLNDKEKGSKTTNRKRKTLQLLFNNILKYTIWIIALFFILDLFGVNSAAIIASIGVFGLVIGLSLQDILRDILAGVFILFEDQYAVGDTVQIGGFKGEVIALGIRATKVRNELGEVKIVANRNINEVINYSLHDSMAIMDVIVAYDTDLELADKVFNDLVTKLSKSIKHIKGNFQFLGIQELDSNITYRITVNTEPMKQLEVRRLALKEIKKALDENHIQKR